MDFKIVSINKKGDNYKVLFENKVMIVVNKELVEKYKLKKDLVLSNDDYISLLDKTNYLNAYKEALNFLKYPLFEKQLRIKLRKKYSVEIVEKVLTKLTEKHYLDDLENARNYYSNKLKANYGSNYINFKLSEFDIDNSQLINLEFEFRDKELKVLNNLVESLKLNDFNDSAIYRKLISKGFKEVDVVEILNLF